MVCSGLGWSSLVYRLFYLLSSLIFAMLLTFATCFCSLLFMFLQSNSSSYQNIQYLYNIIGFMPKFSTIGRARGKFRDKRFVAFILPLVCSLFFFPFFTHALVVYFGLCLSFSRVDPRVCRYSFLACTYVHPYTRHFGFVSIACISFITSNSPLGDLFFS